MQNGLPRDRSGLPEIFIAHRGRLADKWEQYLAIYDAELARFQESGTPVQLLEIGVQNGGSLEIWAKFLPPGSSVVGIDINPECASLHFEGNVTVLVANAADKAALEAALGDRIFDVIIDDGSHLSQDIIGTFHSTFPRLAPGGLYIIEDLHAAYWHEYGGGFRTPGSAIEWLKDLVDSLHTDHFERPDLLAPEVLKPLRAMNQEIGRISFYDSISVIERQSTPKLAPWRRATTGVEAPVQRDMMSTIGVFELAQGADVFLSAAAAAARRRLWDNALQAALDELRDEVARVPARLADTEARLAEMAANLSAKQACLSETESRLSEARTCLVEAEHRLADTQQLLTEATAEADRERRRANAIEGSTIWRTSAPLRRVLNKLRGIR